MHWLGEKTLDEYVLRALRATEGCGCKPVYAMTDHLLHRDGLIASFQFPLEEDDVLTTLFRLTKKERIVQYVDQETGGTRYRL